MSEPLQAALAEQEIVIRTGTAADLGALALVMVRAYSERDNLSLPKSANQAAHDEIKFDFGTSDAWTYVAVKGDRIAGFALGFPSSEATDISTDHQTDYLSLLMVEPGFWGHGIGNRLLDTIEDSVRSANKQRLVLWTRQANNGRAQSIYERRGYKRTGITKQDGPYGPQYQYQLDL